MKQNLSFIKQVKVFVLFVLITCCSFATYAAELIQRIEIPTSIYPDAVGSGARAMGMGAFIAIADDATAASWNPGGLINLQVPEVSVVGTFLNRTENILFGTHPEANGHQALSDTSLNYLSAVYPFNFWGRNMVISLNYQKLYDFNRKWELPMILSAPNLLIRQNTDYRQEGELSALGVAYCIQITPRFSLGFMLNIWDDNLTPNIWEQKIIQIGAAEIGKNKIPLQFQSYDRYSFSGINMNAGFLWHITDKMTIGAVLKTPFTANIRHEQTFSGIGMSSSSTVNDEQLTMPMSYGIGFAYKFSDVFIGSFDMYRTQWNDFIAEDSQGRETSPITGKPSSESDIKPVYKVRLGAEYFFLTSQYQIPLRCGVFYDPDPAEGGADTIWGISLGSGISYKVREKRIIFDIAYQYRWGNNIGTSIMKNLNFSQDIDEHTVYSSVILRF